MSDNNHLSSRPKVDDALVDEMLTFEESRTFECKRVGGKLSRILESIVAFANTDGGLVVLGLEDPDKAQGRDRVYGIQENPMVPDELHKAIQTRITPKPEQVDFFTIGCTLRDGTLGSIVIIRVLKSDKIHSIVSNGTWLRLTKSNKSLVAEEITRLSLERGAITAEARLVDIPFDLLETDYWRLYATQRKLTRPIDQALKHLGLAIENPNQELLPIWAAVLLFAEEPGGLLRTKAAVRVFHYKGEKIQHQPTPNLAKPPVSFSGPLLTQIQQSLAYVLSELSTGVQMGSSGFEIVQKYPVRVIREAITNAVIHRDYSLVNDIHIRLFSDRIEIESPGTLPGKITARNIQQQGSFNRNPLIVSGLREFPDPPNLDAGEGVRMMYQTMDTTGLYPPLYLTRATTGKDQVQVILFNENRPSIWNLVDLYLDQNESINNNRVKEIMKTEDTLGASRMLKKWVGQGLLVVANPDSGKKFRKYRRSEQGEEPSLLSSVIENKNQ